MARWINRRQMTELVAKLSNKTQAELELICDQFADGATYEGGLVYLTELRRQMYSKGMLKSDTEASDNTKDISL